MAEQVPDFSVDSKGNAAPERAVRAFGVLDLPSLIQAVGESKSWGGYEKQLAAQIGSRKDALYALYPVEDTHRDHGASHLLYDPVFKPMLEKALKDADIPYPMFERAWRRAFDMNP